MSAQTKAAVDWNVSAFIWLPVFTLIGILLWAIVRPLEQKRLGR
jgi:flagellar biosynthesis/type III secretory pathway M-ring protein FliF/YscJ